MRRGLRAKRWLFWGERLREQPDRWRDEIQQRLIAPIACAEGIVGVGRAATADYFRRFPDLRHFCIAYHCNLTPFLAAPRKRSGGPVSFLFCGQMIRRKGVDLLLAAFDRLVAKGFDVTLRLVGRRGKFVGVSQRSESGGDRENLLRGISDACSAAGVLSRSPTYSVLPSRHDGWGVVVNQALGAGLPVIVSDAVGAGLDLVEDGVNGLRFAADDLAGLLHCMESIASSPDKARQWGDASRRKALTITPEAGAEKWVQVLENLARGQ